MIKIFMGMSSVVVGKKTLIFPRTQGSTKVLSTRPRQVEFPAGQVTFHRHLPNKQRLGQVVCQQNKKRVN